VVHRKFTFFVFDGFRSSGTELDERGDLSGEEAKSRRAWRLGGLALDCVRGRSAAALSLALSLSLSSLDINTYFSHSLRTVRPHLLSVILSRDPPSRPSPAVNLEPLRRNSPFGLLTTSHPLFPARLGVPPPSPTFHHPTTGFTPRVQFTCCGPHHPVAGLSLCVHRGVAFAAAHSFRFLFLFPLWKAARVSILCCIQARY